MENQLPGDCYLVAMLPVERLEIQELLRSSGLIIEVGFFLYKRDLTPFSPTSRVAVPFWANFHREDFRRFHSQGFGQCELDFRFRNPNALLVKLNCPTANSTSLRKFILG